MELVYAPAYRMEIGPHVFPTVKYDLVHDRLVEAGLADPAQIVTPVAARWADLALVHTDEYLTKVRRRTLTPAEVALLELPLTDAVTEGFRVMAAGSVDAARRALSRGCAAHIGGGLHHAFANHGEGFCLFNDVALAIRVLRREGRLRRSAVVDCDVHHGNGTAMIFERDETVFTFSIHQQHNYPLFKPRGRLDIGLADGTGDDEYLARLGAALPAVMASHPDLIIYLAGADPYHDDQLGGLALTREGLRARDEMVLDAAAAAGVAVAVLLAGGYARRLDDTVAIHVGTLTAALERQDVWRRDPASERSDLSQQ